jgi:hypothetical protein
MVVSKLLEVADIADIAAALNPVPLLLSAPVTGRNFLASQVEVEDRLGLVTEAYGVSAELVFSAGTGDPVQEADRMLDWLVSR